MDDSGPDRAVPSGLQGPLPVSIGVEQCELGLHMVWMVTLPGVPGLLPDVPMVMETFQTWN